MIFEMYFCIVDVLWTIQKQHVKFPPLLTDWSWFHSNTRSVQKIRELFELRGSNWFQENQLGVARFVQNSWLKRRFPVADIFICW